MIIIKPDENQLDYGSKVYSNTNNEHVKQTIFMLNPVKRTKIQMITNSFYLRIQNTPNRLVTMS